MKWFGKHEFIEKKGFFKRCTSVLRFYSRKASFEEDAQSEFFRIYRDFENYFSIIIPNFPFTIIQTSFTFKHNFHEKFIVNHVLP